MSELTYAGNAGRNIRFQLLMTVSAVAVLPCLNIQAVNAADDESPTVWIELGGQADHVMGQGDHFSAPFIATNAESPLFQSITPLQAQTLPSLNFGLEGRLSFEPQNTDWVFSVGARYARSSNFKHVDHQTDRTFQHYDLYGNKGLLTSVEKFSDTQVHNKLSNTILDFSVGRDVGIGLFGKEGSSVISAGVRFAQFSRQSTFDIRARPDLRLKYLSPGAARDAIKYYHNYHANGYASRNFHGVGPSLSWNGSIPVLGVSQRGKISLDLGGNAAILFGKQRAHVQHHESEYYYNGACGRFVACSQNRYSSVYHHPGGHNTDRTVVVPNLGGFVGASFLLENFKASLGYRADFFFGAMDTGIDTPKSETLGFHGPFVSVSVGFGG